MSRVVIVIVSLVVISCRYIPTEDSLVDSNFIKDAAQK